LHVFVELKVDWVVVAPVEPVVTVSALATGIAKVTDKAIMLAKAANFFMKK
jgi:hypothetical protein